MNQQSKPHGHPLTVMQVGEQSNADIEAGRVEDFDAHMARLRCYVEARSAEIEHERRRATSTE